jgi:hypothetical protein
MSINDALDKWSIATTNLPCNNERRWEQQVVEALKDAATSTKSTTIRFLVSKDAHAFVRGRLHDCNLQSCGYKGEMHILYVTLPHTTPVELLTGAKWYEVK